MLQSLGKHEKAGSRADTLKGNMIEHLGVTGEAAAAQHRGPAQRHHLVVAPFNTTYLMRNQLVISDAPGGGAGSGPRPRRLKQTHTVHVNQHHVGRKSRRTGISKTVFTPRTWTRTSFLHPVLFRTDHSAERPVRSTFKSSAGNNARRHS